MKYMYDLETLYFRQNLFGVFHWNISVYRRVRNDLSLICSPSHPLFLEGRSLGNIS